MASHAAIRLTADDAACKDEIDKAILELVSLRMVTHVAAFTTYGRLRPFSRALGTNVPLGIHFNLSSGRPLSKPSLIRSLTDELGKFYCPTPKDKKDMHSSLNTFLQERVPKFFPSEIKIELAAQLNAFKQDIGRMPDFYTMHHDLDQIPIIQEAMKGVVGGESGRQCLLRAGTIAGVFCTFLTPQDNLEEATVKILSMLEKAVSVSEFHNGAVTEIVCHPGYASDDMSDFTVYINQRELELKVWSGPKISEVFKKARRLSEGWHIDDINSFKG